MSGTDIRVADLPDLGAVTDASSIVADVASGTGRFSALAVKAYCAVATLPDAPFTNTPYGRRNGAWTPVLGDAPSNNLTYARLNASWATVVPEAPLTGNVYGRSNGGWTDVLPTSGGSISGNLSVTGNVTAGNAVLSNQFFLAPANGYQWGFYVDPGSLHHVQTHGAGWLDIWQSTDGLRRWTFAGTDLMSLAGTGVFTTASYVNATGFWVGSPAGQFGLSPGGAGRILEFSPSFYLEYVTADATLQLRVSNGPLWVMRATDDFCFNAQSNVGGVGAYLNVSDRRGKTGIVPTAKGLAEVLQLQPVEFDRDNPATGTQHEIGFVAQDVQPIVPEAVWTAGIPLRDGSGGLDSAEPTLALSESTITALNVNAIKEMHAMVVALTDRIAALEAA